ncbi:MAG: hypothetical protein WCK65_05965, partial [Rhodospirillaceae bacterium]
PVPPAPPPPVAHVAQVAPPLPVVSQAQVQPKPAPVPVPVPPPPPVAHIAQVAQVAPPPPVVAQAQAQPKPAPVPVPPPVAHIAQVAQVALPPPVVVLTTAASDAIPVALSAQPVQEDPRRLRYVLSRLLPKLKPDWEALAPVIQRPPVKKKPWWLSSGEGPNEHAAGTETTGPNANQNGEAPADASPSSLHITIHRPNQSD